MTKVAHWKGIKPAIQFPKLKKISKIVGRVKFSPNCIYNLPNQYDGWNKLDGIKKSFFNPHNETAMIGWRSKNGMIELVPYFHFTAQYDGYMRDQDMIKVGGGTAWTFSVPWARVYPERWVDYSIELDVQANSWIVAIGDQWVKLDHSLLIEKGWDVGSWFGGQHSPPQKMNFILETERS